MHPPYCAVQRKLTPSPTLHHPLASPHMSSAPFLNYVLSGENTGVELLATMVTKQLIAKRLVLGKM